MIMRPTVIERSILTGSSAHSYLQKMVDSDMLITAALIKNLLFTVKGAERYIKLWDEERLSDKAMVMEYAVALFQHISEESARQQVSVNFSTTEVAKYLGVSPQTINTWIRQGKIVGAEKEGQKWSKISENAEVIFANGNRVSITILKANWEAENLEPEVDEVTYLQKSIEEFEQNYGGTFEVVFGNKTIKELTAEDTDASVWWSYKARLASANVSQR